MSFRTRILLAALLAAIAPLLLFAVLARREVKQNLRGQFSDRVAVSSEQIQQDLERQTRTLDTRLRALAQQIENTPSQRAALLGLTYRSALLDYAASAMTAAGLDYLLLLDSAGAVLSSGHFRNEYDRVFSVHAFLATADGPILIDARRPQGAFRVLARAVPFEISGQRFLLVGGITADSAFISGLARDPGVTVSLALAGAEAAVPADALQERVAVPYIDDTGNTATAGEARWIIAHSTAGLQSLQRGIDKWVLTAGIAAVILAFLIARLLAARVTRPLEALAAQSARVHLDRIDVGFANEREDEIGSLSQMLDAMVQRLRKNAQDLRSAERRATVGDMARQVNHDIRNGLLPIRNVITHLAEVAHKEPEQLPEIFKERESTLQGGVAYLESLATNYARLSPRTERQLCDVNAIIRTVLRDMPPSERLRVQVELTENAPRVAADPVALRRIVENLTINALESLENGNGAVTVKTQTTGNRIDVVIADTGPGIAPDALERIFDDFYTTKTRGSGLGLSIVRRLVADMGGRIRVDSTPGRGSTFVVELPVAS